jgi:hypothetical protein
MSQDNKDLSASVPTLNGPNWIIWEAQMKAYLRTKGLWQLVTGNEQRPRDLPSGRVARPAQAATDTTPAVAAVTAIPFPTNAEVSARSKEKMDWDNKDDQALGIITLKIAHSLRTHIGATANVTWNNLSTAFSTPGPAAIFNDFAKVVNLRIQPNRHPASEMNTMWDLFERLKAQNVDIPKVLRALILLNAIPPTLQSVVSVTLQTKDTGELSFDDIRNDISTIYEQTVRGANPNANKLSAVKRKGPDPLYSKQRPKKFQPSDQPDRPQQGSSKDGEHPPRNRKRGSGRGRG